MHVHFAQAEPAAPKVETSRYLPPLTPPVTPPQWSTKTIHYEEPFNGISAHETRIGTQTVGTQPKYVPTPSFPSPVKLGYS
jgi:hypothetical protein